MKGIQMNGLAVHFSKHWIKNYFASLCNVMNKIHESTEKIIVQHFTFNELKLQNEKGRTGYNA